MKVLMLGNDATVKGGITSVISQLLEYDWDKNGIKMDFIPTYVEGNALKKISFFLCAYFRIIKRAIMEKPDVVHMHMSYRGSFVRAYVIYLICNIVGIKKIIHLHGSEFSEWYNSCNLFVKKIIRRFIKKSEVFVVLGKEWERRIKEIEPETNVVVVNNTTKIPDKICLWNTDEKAILFMGVLIQRKGVKDLLDAISLLKNEEKIPKNVVVIVAGSGKEEEFLKEHAFNLKINDIVRFVGWIDKEDKEDFYLKSNMLVLPSYNEGLPMVVLEAMSYGLPVIASDVGDMKEAVAQGENGYLIEPGNIRQLAEMILKVLEFEQEQWEDHSRKSRMIAKTKFADEQYEELFVRLYKRSGV